MDERQSAIHEALHQIDPELAGLFARGCELLDRIEQPGVRYLIGHIGRELSNAVLYLLARELPSVTGGPAPEDAAGDENRLREEFARILGVDRDDSQLDAILEVLREGHRETIARALSLDTRHPLVRSWLQLQRVLVAATHYRKGAVPPAVEKVRAAFYSLVGLLFGRVGPYFSAQADLDALLTIADPTPEHIARARELLVRPQLRFRFFRELNQPAWLRPLRGVGVFNHPPEWAPTKDGGYRTVFWPEGECLVRLADHEPDLVLGVLERIPPGLDNPAVWQVVARAVLVLPASHAPRLAPVLAKAARRPQPRFFVAPVIIDAIRRLGEMRELAAFKLFEALLGLKSPPKDTGPEETKWFRRRPERLLECLDPYELGELLEKAVPSLAALDAGRLWSILIGRLKRARYLMAAAGFDDDDMSQHWCESLEAADADDDFRARLAVTATETARRIVVGDPSRAEAILGTLADEGGGLFARMYLAVLTVVGPAAQERLDRMVADPTILHPPHGAREVAALLRSRFAGASAEARIAFVRSLEEGPGLEALRSMVEWREGDPDDADAQRYELGTWQRRRLRWFHDRLPDELQALAAELGVVPKQPSVEEQALDEVGFYMGGVYSRGESSPRRLEELRDLRDDHVLQFLREWQPSADTMEGPSRRGLADTLTTLIEDAPAARAALIRGIATAPDLHPTYRRAALAAIRRAAERDREIPWAEAVEAVAGTLTAAEQGHDAPDRDEWRWARQEAVELLEDGCTHNRIPQHFRARLFELVSLALDTSPRWSGDHPRPLRQFGDVVLATLNSDEGKVTYLMMAAALWAFRADAQELDPTLRAQVRSWLDRARERADAGRVGSRASLGEFLPQILLLDRDWVLAHAEDLLGTGMTDPLGNPTWGAYLTMGSLHGDSFATLRPWMGRHVGALAELLATENAVEKPDTEWQVGRHFLEHVGNAYMRGYVGLGEADRVVEIAFASTRAEDRSHVYWQIHRGWSGAKAAHPSEYVERLLQLWEWRLGVLETASESEQLAAEADGLGWFVLTTHLPTDRVLPLARRTVQLAPGRRHTRRMIWSRLSEFATIDPGAAISMAEQLIEAELSGEWQHFDVDEMAPTLRLGLVSADSGTKDRTRWLIHRLGDRGWSEFGKLLEPRRQP